MRHSPTKPISALLIVLSLAFVACDEETAPVGEEDSRDGVVVDVPIDTTDDRAEDGPPTIVFHPSGDSR